MRNPILILLTLAILTGLTACERRHTIKKNHIHRYSVEKVQVYRVPVVETNRGAEKTTQTGNDNSWLYYYLIWNQDNSACVYASSSTPVSQSGFSSLSWQRGASIANITGGAKPEALPEEEIPDQELGQQAIHEITTESTEIETIDTDAEPGSGYVNQDGNETTEMVSEPSTDSTT